MDTKFSVALHILVMISESEEKLSSQALATSIGTNASYVRKVISLLKNAQLIISQQGKSEYQLSKDAKLMSLLEVYTATQEIVEPKLFQLHQNMNMTCPVGKNIEGAISPIFTEVEATFTKELTNHSVQDVIDNLYKFAKSNK